MQLLNVYSVFFVYGYFFGYGLEKNKTKQNNNNNKNNNFESFFFTGLIKTNDVTHNPIT